MRAHPMLALGFSEAVRPHQECTRGTKLCVCFALVLCTPSSPPPTPSPTHPPAHLEVSLGPAGPLLEAVADLLGRLTNGQVLVHVAGGRDRQGIKGQVRIRQAGRDALNNLSPGTKAAVDPNAACHHPPSHPPALPVELLQLDTQRKVLRQRPLREPAGLGAGGVEMGWVRGWHVTVAGRRGDNAHLLPPLPPKAGPRHPAIVLSLVTAFFMR